MWQSEPPRHAIPNVSCSKPSIHRLLSNHANGKLKGPVLICSDADMEQIAKSLDEEVGGCTTSLMLKWCLRTCKQRNWRKPDKEVIEMSICDTTVKDYSVMLAEKVTLQYHSHTCLSETLDVLMKIPSVNLLLLFLELLLPLNVWPLKRTMILVLKLLPRATCKLYDIVTNFLGTPVYPIPPWLMYSTNYTIGYISEGAQNAFLPSVLTAASSISKQGTMT